MLSTPRPVLLGLLDDVKRTPADLTAWLVLCDWLEEHGDEVDRARGDYCRLCFGRLGRKTVASDWECGEQRRALYRQYHAAWLAPLPLEHVRMHHGLIELSLPASTCLRLEKDLADTETWAWVETLDVFGLNNAWLQRLADCRLLNGPAQVRLSVSWGERISRGALRQLADSPHLAAVRRLGIRAAHVVGGKTAFQPLHDRFGDRFRANEGWMLA